MIKSRYNRGMYIPIRWIRVKTSPSTPSVKCLSINTILQKGRSHQVSPSISRRSVYIKEASLKVSNIIVLHCLAPLAVLPHFANIDHNANVSIHMLLPTRHRWRSIGIKIPWRAKIRWGTLFQSENRSGFFLRWSGRRCNVVPSGNRPGSPSHVNGTNLSMKRWKSAKYKILTRGLISGVKMGSIKQPVHL